MMLKSSIFCLRIFGFSCFFSYRQKGTHSGFSVAGPGSKQKKPFFANSRNKKKHRTPFDFRRYLLIVLNQYLMYLLVAEASKKGRKAVWEALFAFDLERRVRGNWFGLFNVFRETFLGRDHLYPDPWADPRRYRPRILKKISYGLYLSPPTESPRPYLPYNINVQDSRAWSLFCGAFHSRFAKNMSRPVVWLACLPTFYLSNNFKLSPYIRWVLTMMADYDLRFLRRFDPGHYLKETNVFVWGFKKNFHRPLWAFIDCARRAHGIMSLFDRFISVLPFFPSNFRVPLTRFLLSFVFFCRLVSRCYTSSEVRRAFRQEENRIDSSVWVLRQVGRLLTLRRRLSVYQQSLFLKKKQLFFLRALAVLPLGFYPRHLRKKLFPNEVYFFSTSRFGGKRTDVILRRAYLRSRIFRSRAFHRFLRVLKRLRGRAASSPFLGNPAIDGGMIDSLYKIMWNLTIFWVVTSLKQRIVFLPIIRNVNLFMGSIFGLSVLSLNSLFSICEWGAPFFFRSSFVGRLNLRKKRRRRQRVSSFFLRLKKGKRELLLNDEGLISPGRRPHRVKILSYYQKFNFFRYQVPFGFFKSVWNDKSLKPFHKREFPLDSRMSSVKKFRWITGRSVGWQRTHPRAVSCPVLRARQFKPFLRPQTVTLRGSSSFGPLLATQLPLDI